MKEQGITNVVLVGMNTLVVNVLPAVPVTAKKRNYLVLIMKIVKIVLCADIVAINLNSPMSVKGKKYALMCLCGKPVSKELQKKIEKEWNGDKNEQRCTWCFKCFSAPSLCPVCVEKIAKLERKRIVEELEKKLNPEIVSIYYVKSWKIIIQDCIDAINSLPPP